MLIIITGKNLYKRASPITRQSQKFEQNATIYTKDFPFLLALKSERIYSFYKVEGAYSEIVKYIPGVTFIGASHLLMQIYQQQLIDPT